MKCAVNQDSNQPEQRGKILPRAFATWGLLQRGFKHGPFYYLVQCLGTRMIKKYLLKTASQRKQARAGIAAHLKFQRQLAKLSEINTKLLRRESALKAIYKNS